MTQIEFDAFVSYRRSDGARVAHWLRRELEGFELPRALRATHGRKLRIYLDTAYERGTSDFYVNTIRPALLASRFLLVVATPDAQRRREGVEDWIQREVSDFTAGPNKRNVIVVRAAGEFADPLPADVAQRFPNIEIVDLRGASRLWFLNPLKASRLGAEKLKLIAPLIDLPGDAMPRLRQEEERRQQARLGIAAGIGLAVLTAVSATSIYALQSSFKAARALEESMFATGRMIITAADASGRARSALLSQGCDLLDKVGEGAPSEPGLQEVVICGIERAASHERLDEQAQARAELERTVAAGAARYRRTPRQDIAVRWLAAQRALAEYLLRRKDNAGAEAAFAELRDRARELLVTHIRMREMADAEAEGAGQIGDLLAARNSRREAEASYLAAADAVGRMIEWDVGKPAVSTVAWQARLYRLASQQRVNLDDWAGALAHAERSLGISRGIKDLHTASSVLDAAHAGVLAAMALQRLGRGSDAARARSEAAAHVERVLAADVDERSRERARQIKGWIDGLAAQR